MGHPVYLLCLNASTFPDLDHSTVILGWGYPCIPVGRSAQHLSSFHQLRPSVNEYPRQYKQLQLKAILVQLPPPHLTFPHHPLLANPTPLSVPTLILPDMSDQSPSSHLKVLFDAALQDYETQTGIALPKHPLAERLQECHSVESITAVLHEQTQAFNKFRGKEKVVKSLENAVSVLHNLSACAKLGEVIGVVYLKAFIGSSLPLTLVP